jgi:hypothetical protein
VGTSVETARAFHDVAARFTLAAQWISNNVQRTNESVTLFNLLTASTSYLEVAGDNIEAHISVVAMVTRNLYEINLQVRDILRSHEGIQRWHAEAVADKIQMLESASKMVGSRSTVAHSGLSHPSHLGGRHQFCLILPGHLHT